MSLLNNESSLSEIAESIQYISGIHLPNLKNKLSNKVGGNVNTQSFDQLIGLINLKNLGGRRWASGTASSPRSYFLYARNDYTGFISVAGLSFKPSIVVGIQNDFLTTQGEGLKAFFLAIGDYSISCSYAYNSNYGYGSYWNSFKIPAIRTEYPAGGYSSYQTGFTNDGFALVTPSITNTFTWYAFE